VTGVRWRKSSYSGDNGGDCVEVGVAGLGVAVRDSKDPDGPLLAFARDEWRTFAERVKSERLSIHHGLQGRSRF